jgi:hypothetical protein
MRCEVANFYPDFSIRKRFIINQTSTQYTLPVRLLKVQIEPRSGLIGSICIAECTINLTGNRRTRTRMSGAVGCREVNPTPTTCEYTGVITNENPPCAANTELGKILVKAPLYVPSLLFHRPAC